MKALWFALVLQVTAVSCETDPLLLQLLRRVDQLENEGRQQKQHILELEEEVKLLKQLLYDEDIDREPDSENQQALNDADNNFGEDLDDGIENNSDEMMNVPSKIYQKRDSDSRKIDRPRRKTDRRFVLDTEMVAFHATLDSGLYEHNHISQVLVFDDVKTNIGGAYNNKTGIFVTPMNGIYIFSVSVMSTASGVQHGAMVDIMKNGNEVGAAFAEGDNFMDQGSVTIVLQLAIGDEVHVGIQRREDSEIWGDKLTSFMGCLITPL